MLRTEGITVSYGGVVALHGCTVELGPGDHPFFVASQYHPEFKSRPTKPHPLFAAFVHASHQHKTAQGPVGQVGLVGQVRQVIDRLTSEVDAGWAGRAQQDHRRGIAGADASRTGLQNRQVV